MEDNILCLISRTRERPVCQNVNGFPFCDIKDACESSDNNRQQLRKDGCIDGFKLEYVHSSSKAGRVQVMARFKTASVRKSQSKMLEGRMYSYRSTSTFGLRNCTKSCALAVSRI